MEEHKQNELFHYGVKGMKWGVIRDAAKASAEASREASKISDTIGKSRGVSKKTKKQLSSMSDSELRAKINRMQMEQQYAALNPSKVSRGANVVSNILSIAGSVAAIGASAATIAYTITKLKK